MYIGQTSKSIYERWRRHVSDAKRRKDMLISRAIKLHGKDVFEIREIDRASTRERADEFEKFYIRLFDTQLRERGYNIAPGGRVHAGFAGKKHSVASKRKISLSGRKNPARHWLGKKFSEETCALMSIHSSVARKDIPDEEIVRLYEQGFNCPMIARVFNSNKTTIRWRLRKLGIKLRPCNWSTTITTR